MGRADAAPRAARWPTELGLGLFASYDDGEGILELGGGSCASRMRRSGSRATSSRTSAASRPRWRSSRRPSSSPRPGRTPDAEALDRQTADAWLIEHCATPEGLQFWRALIAAIISAEASETSLLHWLFYVKSGGLIDMLVSTTGGAQESRIRGGSQALATGLAARLADVRASVPGERDRAGRRGRARRPRRRRAARSARDRRAAARRWRGAFATRRRCRRIAITSSRTAPRAG